MITIFSITAFCIILYLIYPVWLMLFVDGKAGNKEEKETEPIDNVSLILLSFNGVKYLKEKTDCLRLELATFRNYELIVIDDNSTDGSIEFLKSLTENEHLTIHYNHTQKGIPYSMNLGVSLARYNYLVFCDQRQQLSENIIRKIVEPLKYANAGAVSGWISHIDKEKKYSFIRLHENILKEQESRSGNLIGVYGPLYALKKQCYIEIPEHIILDDLYLSLKVLKTKQIEIRKDCQVTDENFSNLYDYKRTRRYLSGLLQILHSDFIFCELNGKQLIMLLWHKYFRIIIPVGLFACYMSLALSVSNGRGFMLAFGVVTTIVILSVLPDRIMFRFRFKNLIRINILYFIALVDILTSGFLGWIGANANKSRPYSMFK